MPEGATGPLLAAGVERRGKDYAYLGSDVPLFPLDGRKLAQIPDATLLSARGDLILTGASGRSAPGLGIWDASDPSQPRDVTPAWLKAWAAAWTARNQAKVRYGWWPKIAARLGAYQGRT